MLVWYTNGLIDGYDLASHSTTNGASAFWVFIWELASAMVSLKCLSQGQNTADIHIEPSNSRSGVNYTRASCLLLGPPGFNWCFSFAPE